MKWFIIAALLAILFIFVFAPYTVSGDDDPWCLVTQIGKTEDVYVAIFYCENATDIMRRVSLSFYNVALEKGGIFWTRRSTIQ